MRRLPCLTAAVAVSASLFFAQTASATVEAITGVTADASLNVTGISTPGGKAFSGLVTANTATHATQNSNTGGEIFAIGSANNINLNVPAGLFLIANGFTYADLTDWGGLDVVKAADDDSAQQDFVVADFSFGGNPDDFSIAAIMPSGQVGDRVYIAGSVVGEANGPGMSAAIQFDDPVSGDPLPQPHGFFGFDISDLLDTNGNNLAADASIKGIRIFEHQSDLTFDPDTGAVTGPIQQRFDLVVAIGDVVQGVVPEPSTMLLAGVSMLGLLARRSRVA